MCKQDKKWLFQGREMTDEKSEENAVVIMLMGTCKSTNLLQDSMIVIRLRQRWTRAMRMVPASCRGGQGA